MNSPPALWIGGSGPNPLRGVNNNQKMGLRVWPSHHGMRISELEEMNSSFV